MGWIFAQAMHELLGQCRLVWVVSASQSSAQKMGQHFGCRYGTQLNQALADPAVDAVVIAASTPAHAELAIACAKAGKPFFVEKPIADTLENGRRMVRAAEESAVPNMVGFHRRYDPAYAQAWSLLARTLGVTET